MAVKYATPLQQSFVTKIEDLRKRLLGDLKPDELQAMKLQIDLLERAAELANDDHSHDTSEHHDHVHSAAFE
jgi:hypothetical protein